MHLSPDQEKALELLRGKDNVYLTGRAGTGKSTVLRQFLAAQEEEIVVLASTGAAAVLVGGRTFHSFFGLGIMEGGTAKTVERALKNPHLKRRMKRAHTVIVDEISMLSGETLACAEEIARLARRNDSPWGGLRFIAVGDFAQLPPITRGRTTTDWAFQHEVWTRTNFSAIALQTVHRSKSDDWTKVLNDVRDGICSDEVKKVLNSRLGQESPDEITHLFGRREEAERYNQQRLSAIDAEPVIFNTDYRGDQGSIDQLKRHSPVPDQLVLKADALVMIRKNETNGLYVNGTLAKVRSYRKDAVTVQLVENGTCVELEPMKFELLNAEGEVTATAKNFPLTLAYGSTIHKAQGATLDTVRMRLAGLWEAGQAYVALSRVPHPDRLYLDSWDVRSIKADIDVLYFHASLPQIDTPL